MYAFLSLFYMIKHFLSIANFIVSVTIFAIKFERKKYFFYIYNNVKRFFAHLLTKFNFCVTMKIWQTKSRNTRKKIPYTNAPQTIPFTSFCERRPTFWTCLIITKALN